MSLVDLSLVYGLRCEALRSHVWRVRTLAGMRLRCGLLRTLRRMRKVYTCNASSKAIHIKGTPLYNISLFTIRFDQNRLEDSNKRDTKMSEIRALLGHLAG